jgi:hypothetical protein
MRVVAGTRGQLLHTEIYVLLIGSVFQEEISSQIAMKSLHLYSSESSRTFLRFYFPLKS